MKTKEIVQHINAWLSNYCEDTGHSGFVIGISGGIDSALTSILCAMTGKKVLLVSMPIRQTSTEYGRAMNHIDDLKYRFDNVTSYDINLTDAFTEIENVMPFDIDTHHLAMANSSARIRMTTLYYFAALERYLVAGTGNKIEDFGVGFYTKYGDGGVDLSPIADLMKSEVFLLAKKLGVIDSIQQAAPTDGFMG